MASSFSILPFKTSYPAETQFPTHSGMCPRDPVHTVHTFTNSLTPTPPLFPTQAYAHEIQHNYNIMHAWLGTTEYGDKSCIM